MNVPRTTDRLSNPTDRRKLQEPKSHHLFRCERLPSRADALVRREEPLCDLTSHRQVDSVERTLVRVVGADLCDGVGAEGVKRPHGREVKRGGPLVDGEAGLGGEFSERDGQGEIINNSVDRTVASVDDERRALYSRETHWE